MKLPVAWKLGIELSDYSQGDHRLVPIFYFEGTLALNRRIRRYILQRAVLLGRLDKLFKAYQDIQCSTKKSDGPFSDHAKEMVQHLLQTAREGYLWDPPGIPLYYLMGKDRDGLIIYRTVRGTNSLERGFHMVVRRIFGSLRASPEVAECILINWILRRNVRVSTYFFFSYIFYSDPFYITRSSFIIVQAKNIADTTHSGSETRLSNLPLQSAVSLRSLAPAYFPLGQLSASSL
jgi:hypothetical protein